MSTPATPCKPSLLRRIFIGPVELRAGWRLLVFFAITLSLIFSSNWLLKRILPANLDEVALYVLKEILTTLFLLFASLVMARFEGRSIARYGLPWRGTLGTRFWQGNLVGLLLISALMASSWAAHVFSYGPVGIHGMEIAQWAAIYGVVFLIIGLREEYYYRGYLLYTLSSGLGFWAAAIGSSAYFGLNHYLFAHVTWLGALNIGMGGLLICLLVRRTGSLWMAIGFHTAVNWSEAFLYGVPVSGHQLPGRFFNSSLSGPEWLNGGPAGPEGSVFLTVLLVVAWFVLSAWLREAKYPDLSKRDGSTRDQPPPAAS